MPWAGLGCPEGVWDAQGGFWGAQGGFGVPGAVWGAPDPPFPRSHLPKIYQAMLVSATLNPELEALQELVLHNPVSLGGFGGSGMRLGVSTEVLNTRIWECWLCRVCLGMGKHQDLGSPCSQECILGPRLGILGMGIPAPQSPISHPRSQIPIPGAGSPPRAPDPGCFPLPDPKFSSPIPNSHSGCWEFQLPDPRFPLEVHILPLEPCLLGCSQFQVLAIPAP